MTLKEAFRFQNKIKSLMYEISNVLMKPSEITITTEEAMYRSVFPEKRNEITTREHVTEFGKDINALVELWTRLLNDKMKLCGAILKVKKEFDDSISINKDMQYFRDVLSGMDKLRSKEELVKNGATGYTFNADGEQTSYRCDLKRVTMINFDRDNIRKKIRYYNKFTDELSSEIDKQLACVEVEYEPWFDVNDDLMTVLEAFKEYSED